MVNCFYTEDAPPPVGTRLSLCQLRPCQEPLGNYLVTIYYHVGSSGPCKDSNSKPFQNPVRDCSKENLQKELRLRGAYTSALGYILVYHEHVS